MKFRLSLTKPQIEFFKLQCRFPLFVAGYGAGKTEALVSRALTDLLANPGAKIGIYVPTYDQIRINIAPRIMEKLSTLPELSEYNRSEQMITVGHQGKFILRSMDNPARIVGYEVFRSHVDEMETMRPEQTEDAWNKIIARNRQRIGEAPNQVCVYTTPDAGFGFTHRLWSGGDNPDYSYVRAPTYSNPFLPPDYVDSLKRTYSEELATAFIEGIWCNLASGTVYTAFSRDTHNSTETVQGNEPLDIGMDFNVERGCAVVFVKRKNGHHAVDEIVNAYDTPDQIQILKERYPNNPIVIWPDSTGKNRKSGNATETDFKQLKLAGYRVKEDFSNPLIKSRVQAVNGALLSADGQINVRVNVDKCPHLTSGLEQQAYDRNGMPDKSPPNWDDINDAFGYFVCRAYPIIRPQSRVTSIAGGY